jgi:hypothetical protein
MDVSMRTFLALMVCALALAAPPTVHAALTLEYWSGVQDFTPYDPATPSSYNPQTLGGLRNWDFTGQQKLSSLSLSAGSQYIVKVVLRDHDSVGNGSGYTLSGDGTFDNNHGLITFGFRFGYAPGVLVSTRDVNATDGKATTGTVWSGTSSSPFATQEVLPWTNQSMHHGVDFMSIGNLFFNPINANGISPFHQANGDVLYPLANIVLTAVSTGTGVLTLSKPTIVGNNPSFGTIVNIGQPGGYVISYDSALWGTGTTLASLGFTVTPAPEPSSMVLAALVVTGVGYRRKWLSRRVCA